MIDDHEFSDAYYINNERTTLKTEWIDNKDKSILRPYIIEVDKDPEIYKKFLEKQQIIFQTFRGINL